MKSALHKDHITTFPELLQFLRAEHGGRPAIRYENVIYTYEELVSSVAKRVDFISGLDLKPGAHLGVIGSNTADTLEWMLAIPASGHVAVMLPSDETESNMRDICKRMDVVGTFGAEWDAESAGKDEAPWADVNPETDAAIFLTSGTTGQPKGVVHTNASMLISVLAEADGFEEYRFGRSMAVLPMYHIFGVTTVLAYLFSGCLIYLDGDIRKIITEIPQFRPTFLSVVPGFLNMIFQLSEAQRIDYLSGVAAIVCGGAPVAEELRQRAQEKGIRFVIGYGMTESGGAVFMNTDRSAPVGSVGRIVPGMTAKVEDGELLISGDSLMKCYYNDKPQTERAVKNGWLRTGDLARFDEQGFLYITGRKKKMIILENGENVSSEELERLLLHDPEIKKCRVSEMTVAGNSVIGAEILPDRDVLGTCDENEVRAAIEKIVSRINAALPAYKRIRAWKTVNGGLTNKCWKS